MILLPRKCTPPPPGQIIQPIVCENLLPRTCPACDCPVCPGGVALVTMVAAGIEPTFQGVCVQLGSQFCPQRGKVIAGRYGTMTVAVPMCHEPNSGGLVRCRGRINVPHAQLARTYCRQSPPLTTCNEQWVYSESSGTHAALEIWIANGFAGGPFHIGAKFYAPTIGTYADITPTASQETSGAWFMTPQIPLPVECGVAYSLDEDPSQLSGATFTGVCTVEFA